MSVVSIIDIVEENEIDMPVGERFSIETLATTLINFNIDDTKEYDEIVYALNGM